MPILNLNNPSFISVTGAGRPNSGGSVAVYAADGLFTTLATIYSDQQKTTPLTNPVTLDDAGAIEIWYEVKVDIRERLPDGTVIRDTLNLDPNAGDPVIQGFNLVDNGSFEVDETSDGQPDNWTITPYVGSAIAITETIVRNGVKALEFNTAGAGTGGGTATSAKFPVTEGSVCSVAFSFFATNATTLNTFKINWYDQDDVLKSTSTVTMPASGSVPTSWTEYQEEITVDAAGTQGEVELTGISSGGANLSSKAYFDGISVINDDSIVDRTSIQTLTNKTLTTPTITSPIIDEILDANGNESLIISTTTSAVNEATLTNAATTNAPSIAATGDDTNIDLQLTGKGTGGVYGTLVRTTAVATTSLSAQTITSIPSWARKITLMFDQVSANGIHTLSVQIGTSGTAETTGYQSVTTEIDAAVIGAQTTSTSSFLASYQSSDAAVINGAMELSNVTGDIWVCTCSTMAETDGSQTITAGRKALAGTLDMVSINTTLTFDGGQINIIYEG